MAISLSNHNLLATLFDAEVVGVYPMSLTELGQVEFIGEAGNRSTVSHALVVITDNKTGKLRRVWQFRHDITGKDERFLKFMKRVKFGTMLIKAAPSMMFTGDKKVAFGKLVRISLLACFEALGWGTWALLVLSLAASLAVFEQRVVRGGLTRESAEAYFKQRLVFGVIVGSTCMAGALLVPANAGIYTHSIAVLLCVATMTVGTLAYAVVPADYLGLGLLGMLPSGGRYLGLGIETGSPQCIVLGVICFALTLFVLRKALANSRWTTQAIEANMRLSDEMHERQRIEAALRESEASASALAGMLRMMCDNVPYMIWAKDLDRPAGGEAALAAGMALDPGLAADVALAMAVLLVEDNPVNQKVALMLLQRRGYRVQLAEDGRAALEAFAHARFSAILMDMQMPVMDGIEATREIRNMEVLRQVARTPIIAMTANAMEGDRERCLEAGMDDYIAKPIRADQLYEQLQRCIRLG